MRLGISSYTYSWAVGVPGHTPPGGMTAQDLLAKADALGVKVVQVADNLPLHELEPGELDAFSERASRQGVQVEVGTRGIAPEHLREYLGLARRMKSRILRVVVDTADDRPAEDDIVRAAAAFVPELEEADVCLAIENHDRFPCRTLAKIIETVGSEHVGVCLDTVNSFGALEGPDVVLDVLGPLTVNLHVKDFAVRRAGHMMGFVIEGRPAGKGRLDVPRLLEKLKEFGRDPNAILELWTPPEDTAAATIEKEDAWAKESVGYLRGLIPEQL